MYLYIVAACEANSQPGLSVAPIKDILWLSSTIPGCVSYRSQDVGSPAIQFFCKHMNSVTPGKPIKDVEEAFKDATAELVNMRFTFEIPGGDGQNDQYISHQTPSCLRCGLRKKVGFLPTSKNLKANP